MPLELKELGTLFSNYETSYPFTKEQAKEELLSMNHIMAYENFFLWFSGYYSIYQNTHTFLMNEDGIIPIPWRYYIAIMAVSTIHSHYLLTYFQQMFLYYGGDEEWLISGIEPPDSIVPEKLKKLLKFNNILAHQPWKLTSKDIQEILQGGKNGWNRDEFVQAALILVNCQRLATICESLKIKINDNTNNLKCVKTNNKIELDNQNMILPNLQNNNENEGGKTKLYNNLTEMNLEETELNLDKNPITRRYSGDDLKIMTDYENVDVVIFNKYISNYCTRYLDFDSYIDTSMSNFVNKYLIFSILIGKMRDVIF